MFGIAITGTVGSLVGMMFWDCEQQQIAGYVDVVRYEYVYANFSLSLLLRVLCTVPSL